MSVITVSEVTKVYNPDKIPVYAVNGVSITVEKGEFIAVIGPSGSGKSTLLNMIGGLDEPTSGEVVIGGHRLSELSEKQLIRFRREHIGFVFQSFNLIPVLTAQENMEFVMLLLGDDKVKRNNRVKELAVEIDLEGKLNSKPSELSGGQQQRVAVARALAPKPTFILADEPTANLDSKSAFKLLDIMARLNEEEKITFIFSTHDPRVISRAKRVINLVDGKIESDVINEPS
ncbi:MAG: ABC transporter ATP-binding protein [Saprospiraceae bacterium]|nr:ABC transporter ATP-binding protein [Saprospiraceae bacterium]